MTEKIPAITPLSSTFEFTTQCEKEKKKKKETQDFYLISQINIFSYWVLAVELTTWIDLELFIMLLQQVVDKNKSMLLNKGADCSK